MRSVFALDAGPVLLCMQNVCLCSSALYALELYHSAALCMRLRLCVHRVQAISAELQMKAVLQLWVLPTVTVRVGVQYVR